MRLLVTASPVLERLVGPSSTVASIVRGDRQLAGEFEVAASSGSGVLAGGDVLLQVTLHSGEHSVVAGLSVAEHGGWQRIADVRLAADAADEFREWLALQLRSVVDRRRRGLAFLSMGIELFVDAVLRDLGDEGSELRSELAAARVRVAFLEGQLHALSEAKAIGDRRITRAALSFALAVLSSVSRGSSDGAAAHIASCEELLELIGD